MARNSFNQCLLNEPNMSNLNLNATRSIHDLIDPKTTINVNSKPHKITPLKQQKQQQPMIAIDVSFQHIMDYNYHQTDDHKADEVDFDNLIFAKNGYKKLSKISKTLQGDLYKAQRLCDGAYVAIKRTNKILFDHHISIQHDTNFIVAENAIKEAFILRYLTAENRPIGDYITKYFDFFETDSDYYLVEEFVDSQINLSKFVQNAHCLLSQHKLLWKEYHKIIKYLLWELASTIHWLHDDMKCCHLDINTKNIMVSNADFVAQSDGKYKISKKIGIKLSDFGNSERFKQERFECNKQFLSIENETYFPPKYHDDEYYDARCCDMFSFGMVLFECMTGRTLYNPKDLHQTNEIAAASMSCSSSSSMLSLQNCASSSFRFCNNGYLALCSGQLDRYLFVNGLNGYFNADCLDLLKNLLCFDEEKRLNANGLLKHKWFGNYYRMYKAQIDKKSEMQRIELLKQKKRKVYFPFY